MIFFLIPLFLSITAYTGDNKIPIMTESWQSGKDIPIPVYFGSDSKDAIITKNDVLVSTFKFKLFNLFSADSNKNVATIDPKYDFVFLVTFSEKNQIAFDEPFYVSKINESRELR